MTDAPLHHPGLNYEVDHYIQKPKAEVAGFGFWVFLMSDLILFACCFATFLTMDNVMGIAGGPSGADLFSLGSIAIQTTLLLLSSFAFGMAAINLKYGDRNTITWLAATMILGLGFLFFELRDFSHIWAGGGPPQRSGYWSSFTLLVGLHGVHVTAGIIWIAVMIAQLAKTGPIPAVKSRMTRLGLYWHFLDIIWIGVFSVVFLRGLA